MHAYGINIYSAGTSFNYDFDVTGHLDQVSPNGDNQSTFSKDYVASVDVLKDGLGGTLNIDHIANKSISAEEGMALLLQNAMEMAASQGGNGTPYYDGFNKVNSTVGTATSMLALTRASVGYLKAGSATINWYSSGWTGGSRASIKTAQLSKLEIVGRVGVGIGFAADTYEFFVAGSISGSHYATNTAMGIVALTPIGFVTIPYFLIDAYYPGGFEAAMRNAAPLYDQMNMPSVAPPQNLMGMP